MKKILFIGGYGYRDVGDEAQLTCILANFRKLVHDVKFVLLCENAEETRNYHHEEVQNNLHYYINKSVNWFLKSDQKSRMAPEKSKPVKLMYLGLEKILNIIIFSSFALLLTFNAKRLKRDKCPLLLPADLHHFLWVLKNSDLLFNIGGGNLTSVWRSEMRYKCLTYYLCRLMDKPIILSGQTIGPLFRLDRYFVKYTLNHVNLITLREKYSEQVVQSIGVTSPLVKLTADDATSLVPADQETIQMTFKSENVDSSYHPLIGLNIIGLTYQKKSPYYETSKLLLARVADYLVMAHKAKVVFIPMQYGTCDDRGPMLEVQQMMTYKDESSIIHLKEYNDRIIKGIVSRLDLAIGFRYHFTVFAVTSGIPAIGIYLDNYYSVKIKGILDLIGLPENAFFINDVSFQKLSKTIDAMLLNRSDISVKIEKMAHILATKSLFSVKYASAILNRSAEN